MRESSDEPFSGLDRVRDDEAVVVLCDDVLGREEVGGRVEVLGTDTVEVASFASFELDALFFRFRLVLGGGVGCETRRVRNCAAEWDVKQNPRLVRTAAKEIQAQG